MTVFRHLRVLPPRVSEQTIAEIRKLLKAAKRGDGVGLAYVLICHGSYTINAVGQANKQPGLARVALRDLDDLLRDRQPRRHG